MHIFTLAFNQLSGIKKLKWVSETQAQHLLFKSNTPAMLPELHIRAVYTRENEASEALNYQINDIFLTSPKVGQC